MKARRLLCVTAMLMLVADQVATRPIDHTKSNAEPIKAANIKLK